MTQPSIFFDRVRTPYGVFQVAASDRGIVRINFPKCHEPERSGEPVPPRVQRTIAQLKSFLARYFSRRLRWKKSPPIDWRSFTSFEQEVLKALQRVRLGSVTTYGRLAAACGHPRAARAVGNALRCNPAPILIPCHRVIGEDSSLGGYQRGRRWKKILLSHERRVIQTMQASYRSAVGRLHEKARLPLR